MLPIPSIWLASVTTIDHRNYCHSKTHICTSWQWALSNGHSVQNHTFKCWRESDALGHQKNKQTKVKINWLKSLCFGCPSVDLYILRCEFAPYDHKMQRFHYLMIRVLCHLTWKGSLTGVFFYQAYNTRRYVIYLPSPVTISPSLKLRLGTSVLLSNFLNCSSSERNSGLIWLLFLLMFFSTSLSSVGGGSWKAWKPGKKRKMLSATSWLGSTRDEPCSLNTWRSKNRTLIFVPCYENWLVHILDKPRFYSQVYSCSLRYLRVWFVQRTRTKFANGA